MDTNISTTHNLTEEAVKYIQQNKDGLTAKELALIYNLSPAIVERIMRQAQTWGAF